MQKATFPSFKAFSVTVKKPLVIHFFVQTVHKQGTFFRVHNFALGLKELGHTVKVYGASYEKGEKNRVENIDGIEYDITACYFPLQRFLGHPSHPMAAIKRIFRSYPECDIAHVFQPIISAWLPWYLNRKKAKQNVYDWDDLWTNGLVIKGNTLLEKWAYGQVKYIEKKGPKTSDYTVTCSNFLLKKANSFGAQKSELVYNGYWYYTPNTRDTSRVKMNLEAGKFYIGFMGRTINEIEMKWCASLLKEALKKYPNVRLALCGMPKDVLNNVDKELLEKIDYLGFLEPMATRDFASAIDIGLLPLEDNIFNQSRFPIKFAEYLAAGTPVFSTNIGECAYIAREFPFVKITSPDTQSWVNDGVEMIGNIIENKWPVVDKEKIAELLDWRNIASKLEKIYIQNS